MIFSYYRFINKKNGKTLYEISLHNDEVVAHEKRLNEMKTYLAHKHNVKSDYIYHEKVR